VLIQISIQALPFDNFLNDLRLEAILGLDELQRLNGTGIGGACNSFKHIKASDIKHVEHDSSSNLPAILHLYR
jgi:hypothetical protein